MHLVLMLVTGVLASQLLVANQAASTPAGRPLTNPPPRGVATISPTPC